MIRSRLLDFVVESLAEAPELGGIEGRVDDSGEGRWAVFEAIGEDVPVPVITPALLMRLVNRQGESFAAKLLASMRSKFGGHSVKAKKAPRG